MSTKKIKKAAVKDFRIYESGVERLKELKKELDSLDTRKFKKEEKRIRKKLKNVSLIPETEEDIRQLKLMIAGVDVRALESKTDRRQDKRLSKIAEKERLVEQKLDFHLPRIKTGLDILAKEEEKTESKLPYVRKLIRGLEKEVIKAQKLAYRKRKQLSSEQVKQVKALPLLRKKIDSLQRTAYALDARQENKINLLEKETEDLNKTVPAIIERINLAEKNVEKLKKRPIAPGMSKVKERIGKLETEIERPKFYERRKFFKKQVKKHFETYEQGIERLKQLEKELNSLDTRNFKKEENEIRKKLHEVSLVPETEEDIRQLRLMIAGVDVRALESKTDKRQDKRLSKIAEKEKLVEEKLDFHLPRIKTGLDILSKEGEKANKLLPKLSRKIISLKDELEKAERLAGRKELTGEQKKNVSKIPALKRQIAGLKKEEEKLGRKLPYIRSLIRELQDRLTRAEDIAYKKRRQLSLEQVKQVKALPLLRKKINLAEKNLEKLEKRPIAPSLSGVKKRISRLETEIERPSFYKKRKFLKREVKKHFETYEKGVDRLKQLEKELNSLDTRKFRKEEKLIRKKLHEVSLVPEIEEDIHQLGLMIAGVDVRALESKTDRRQDKKLKKIANQEKELWKKIPGLKRKLARAEQEIEKAERLARRKELTRDEKKEVERIPELRKKLNRIIAEIERESYNIEKIPALKRKTGFLSRIFRKEEFDIENLGNRLDKNRLEFNERLINEISESRRMIQAGDEELRGHFHELLIEVIRKMNKKKEDSEKKLQEKIKVLEEQLPSVNKKTGVLKSLLGREEEQITEIKGKLEAERQEFNEGLYNDVKEAKKMVEDSKFELKKQLLDSLDESVKELRKERELSEKKLFDEIRQVEEKIELGKKDVSENFAEKLSQIRKKISENKKELEEDSQKKLEELKKEIKSEEQEGISEISASQASPAEIKQKKNLGFGDLGFDLNSRRNPNLPASFEALHSGSLKSLPKIKSPALKSKKISESRLPNKIFMTDEEFEVFYSHFLDAKKLISAVHNEVEQDVALRKTEQKELFACAEDYSKIKEKFAKLGSFFKAVK